MHRGTVSSVPATTEGARERRKRQTRAALVEAAERLFRARGYDGVTVAEIAAEAGVSVKTLFVHFRSKEDLLFADEDTLLDHLVAAIRDRAAGVSPLDALAAVLTEEIDAAQDDLESFHRMVGDSPAIASRLRRMWEDYEDALARALAEEANEATPSPRTRLAAAQLIALVRVVTSTEVRAFVGARRTDAQRRAALKAWVAEAADQVGDGLRTVL